MFSFVSSDLLKWFHFVAIALYGGSAMVALLLSGLEDTEEAFKGIAAAVWSKVVVWSLRIAVLSGLVLLFLEMRAGSNPFAARYFVYKIVFAIIMLGVTETGVRPLAKGKRGAAMLAIVLFLLASFTVINKRAFGGRVYKEAPYSTTTTPAMQAR
jgi:hypothetical protein